MAGTVYWQSGKMDQTNQGWDKAYRVRPDLTPLLNNLGLYYAREGDEARAMSYYRHAMRLQPSYSVAHFNLAAMDEAAGRDDLAGKEYRTGLATNPKNVDALAALRKLQLESDHEK